MKKASVARTGPFPFHGGPLDGQFFHLTHARKVHIYHRLGEDEAHDMKHVYRREYVPSDPKPGELISQEPTIHYVYDPQATQLANHS